MRTVPVKYWVGPWADGCDPARFNSMSILSEGVARSCKAGASVCDLGVMGAASGRGDQAGDEKALPSFIRSRDDRRSWSTTTPAASTHIALARNTALKPARAP